MFDFLKPSCLLFSLDYPVEVGALLSVNGQFFRVTKVKQTAFFDDDDSDRGYLHNCFKVYGRSAKPTDQAPTRTVKTTQPNRY